MNLQHVNVTLRVDGELPIELGRFIEVFHPWVAQQSLEGMLIDVADYRHVPDGPGVVLIGFEGDYYMTERGLRYSRKAPLEGSNADKFRQAFAAAAAVASRLEAEFEGLKFCRQNFDLTVNDRAIAPNTSETFEAVKGELEAFLNEELGAGGVTLEHQSDPRKLFGVAIRCETPCDLGV